MSPAHHTARLMAKAASALQRGSARMASAGSSDTTAGSAPLASEPLASGPLAPEPLAPGPSEPFTPASFETTLSPSLDIDARADVDSTDFGQVVAHELEVATTSQTVALLFASIDYFDVVTASHGRDIAEEILATVSDRITDTLRNDDYLTSYGDDGFAVLWAQRTNASDVSTIATRIASKFNEPIITSAGQLPITVSVGIATATGDQCRETNVQTLACQARSAVVSVQRSGRAQIAFFDGSVQQRAIETYQTERHLHAAIRDEQVDVAFQSIVNLSSGKVVGVETLARWNDETLGSISPATFIPIAEESGLIGDLGRLVLANAIAQGSKWNAENDSSLLITVNLSNRQLLDPQLVPTIKHMLDEFELAPPQLCLEVSESVVMDDVASSMTILGHLRDLGLCLAVDDFGTGYSSLSYLRKLPVDILKIDKSFVQSIYNRDDRVITKAIIDLAHTLGMTTVAEGVETRLQIEVLHALDCDMAQGFYLQTPAAAEDVDFGQIDFAAPSPIESPGLLSFAPAVPVRSFARR